MIHFDTQVLVLVSFLTQCNIDLVSYTSVTIQYFSSILCIEIRELMLQIIQGTLQPSALLKNNVNTKNQTQNSWINALFI